MPTLRTPMEVALGHRLPLDFSDLDRGDYELEDRQDAAREADLLAAALDMGDFLYREAVRSRVPRLGGVR